MFLDIEGLPDSEFNYLIGALIVIDEQSTFHSFWADNRNEEPKIFSQFIDTVSALTNFQVFHFGNYEMIALKRAKQKLEEHLKPKIDWIIEKSVNVLSVVHPNIYFPTYSNGLKEIGRYLGYNRIDEGATGLDTIAWRKEWENSQSLGLKSKIIDTTLTIVRS